MNIVKTPGVCPLCRGKCVVVHKSAKGDTQRRCPKCNGTGKAGLVTK